VTSYVVAQLGARMHYAVPRMLHAEGQLTHLFTDLAANKGWLRLCGIVPAQLQTDGLRRILGRTPKGVPGDRVTAFNRFGMGYAHRCRQARSSSEFTRAFLWAGRTFCRRVLKRGLGSASGVYVFNSAGLEILERARIDGRQRVIEQTIAPRRIEQELMRSEQERFPDWQAPVDEDPIIDDYCDREEAEWHLSNVILCGSSFVKRGIAARGGPVERCRVVPYGVDDRYRLPLRQSHGGPLRVLTVGGVGLRKGSPYVLAAARALSGVAQFRMVGAIEASAEAAAKLSEWVELTGSVPRSDMRAHFAWADVFLLPSLCEGSATAVYEALTASLPVVCSENTGSVVRDRIEGRIVAIRDSEAIIDALLALARDPELRREMAGSAGDLARSFDLAAYGARLRTALAAGGSGAEA
jgi:glycosyltransferase involved in cell wall biosynthesis